MLEHNNFNWKHNIVIVGLVLVFGVMVVLIFQNVFTDSDQDSAVEPTDADNFASLDLSEDLSDQERYLHYYIVATNYYAEERYGEAELALQTAISQNPTDENQAEVDAFLKILADVNRDQELADNLSDYEKDPQNVGAALAAATIYRERGENDKAITIYEELLTLDASAFESEEVSGAEFKQLIQEELDATRSQ